MNIGFRKAAVLMLTLSFALITPGCTPPKAAPTPQVTAMAVEPAKATTVEPSTVTAAEPTAAGQSYKSILAVPTIWDKKHFEAIVKKLNAALAQAGQEVEVDVQPVPFEKGNPAFLGQVDKELAAGKPSADAYTLPFADSSALFDKGLTKDLTDTIAQYAPAYAAKYEAVFPQKLTGIPVGIRSQSLPHKMALMLREDYTSAGKNILTTDDLFRFLGDTIEKPEKKQVVLAYENDLVLQWALEQGYYDLTSFGVDGYLLCRMDDADFTPVPLESIPGFAKFIAEMKRHQLNGSIGRIFGDNAGRECIAYFMAVNDFYLSNVYVSVPYAPGKFIAQPFSPELPAYFDEPRYTNELAVPAVCPEDRVAAILQFVEWMYGSQDSYDSVIYGASGTDFEDVDGIYRPLKQGKALQEQGLEQVQDLFFSWPGAETLYNFDYYRLPSSVPENIQQVVDTTIEKNLRFPLSAHVAGNNRAMLDKPLKMSDAMQALAHQRVEMLNQLIQSDPKAFNEDMLTSNLGRIAGLNNKELVAQATATLDKMVQSKQ